MMRFANVLAALGSILLAGSLAAAQTPPQGQPQGRGGPPQPEPTNLQVFPKDTTRAQLLPIMQNIAASLGVQCTHCHVMEGRGGRNDMASDEKPTKKTARQMMILVREINDKIPAAVSKSADATTRVACVTCHRGVTIPKQLADILTETATAKGTPAAVEQYRELRTRHSGGMAYDFSETGLLGLANRVRPASPDDALKWLQLNLEFNPKSARTYLLMAQIQNQKGDKDSAIKSLEKAIEIDPANNQAKQMLQQIKGGI